MKLVIDKYIEIEVKTYSPGTEGIKLSIMFNDDPECRTAVVLGGDEAAALGAALTSLSK